MKRLILTAMLLASIAHAQTPPAQSRPATPSPAAHSAFTAEQRAEIVQILRDSLRTDPTLLRDGVAALQQDEQQQQDAAARGAIAAEGRALTENPADPATGPADADVTVVEFYDTRCPYCRRLPPTLAALLKADPKLRIVYKDLPILGPVSLLEARALLAAKRQGGYARLQDALLADPVPSTLQTLRATAQRLGMDGARLTQDMGDPSIQAQLEANLQLARTLHVDGTPAFVIGHQLIPGAVSLAELQTAVAAARTQ